jgi:hypothetical protein
MAKSSKFQAPSSKEAPSSKPTCALYAVSSVFLEVWGLKIGTSLELGVWCLVFRSVAAQKLRPSPLIGAPLFQFDRCARNAKE